jgi:hypothetical protein
MPVVMMIEFNNPKEPDRTKKKYDLEKKHFEPYYEEKVKSGIKWKAEDYTDGSGWYVAWMEFETMEEFTKIWTDEVFQRMFTRFSNLVDDCKVRILRPRFYDLKLE